MVPIFFLRELGVEGQVCKAHESMFLYLGQLSHELVFSDDFRVELQTAQYLQNEWNKAVLTFFNFTLDQIGGHNLWNFRHGLEGTSEVAAHVHLESHVTYEDDGYLRRDNDKKGSQEVSKRDQVILVAVQ